MAFCRQCGNKLERPDLAFCTACGGAVEDRRETPPESSAGSEEAQETRGGRLPPPKSIPGATPVSPPLERPPVGQTLLSIAMVVVVCGVLSAAGWIPFSIPSRYINQAVGDLALFGMCSRFSTGSAGMFLCSAGVGLGTVALGPLLTAGALFLVRKQVAWGIRGALGLLGPRMRFLTAPVVATAVFLVAWAGTQYHAGDQAGLFGITNRLFPVVVGLFTFMTVSGGARFQARFAGFFRARDQVSTKVRAVALLVITSAIGVFLTTVVNEPALDVPTPYLYQQLIVVSGLVWGYLLLAPTDGQVLAPARRFADRLGVSG